MTGDKLRRLIEPTINGLGYELSDLEVKIGGREGVIRIYIDRLPEGIGLEDPSDGDRTRRQRRR